MLQSRPGFLTEADMDLIHAQTMRLLDEVGVVVPVAKALEVFKWHQFYPARRGDAQFLPDYVI